MAASPTLRPDGGRDALALAMNRVLDARPIGGNRVTHHPDSPAALERMLARIGAARERVHLENYIIRADATGRRFADALIGAVGRGAAVRVLYDAFGCRATAGAYWRRLRHAGVEARAFHPLFTTHPLDALSRNHRKLLVVDGGTAFVGGLCIGDEWAGDPSRNRLPWRDTVVEVEGPAALALERTFARVWSRAGPPLPAGALDGAVDAPGEVAIRVVDGVPGRARIYRAAQMAYATAVDRIWIWDAYLVAPPPLATALLDAARGGVDVRLLVPGTSDAPLVRNLTRVGYREFLDAGIRIFEWQGPMLHAKVTVADRRWTRVGSSNLNVSSLYANYELDILVESAAFSDELAAQHRRDQAQSTEVVLRPGLVRRRLVKEPPDRPPPGAGAGAPSHQWSLYERRIAAAVTLRRLAGGLRRTMAAATAAVFAGIGLVLVIFPRISSVVLATGAFATAAALAVAALRSRRGLAADD